MSTVGCVPCLRRSSCLHLDGPAHHRRLPLHHWARGAFDEEPNGPFKGAATRTPQRGLVQLLGVSSSNLRAESGELIEGGLPDAGGGSLAARWCDVFPFLGFGIAYCAFKTSSNLLQNVTS